MTLSDQTRRRQQSLARLIRRAPGYRWAQHELLPRVRRSPVLTDLAWRVFVPSTGAGETAVPFQAGRYLDGGDVDRLPIIGVVALGLDEQGVRDLVAEVATLQREVRTFRPLLVLDRPAFSAAREHGFVVEVLLSRAQWGEDEQSWSAYVGERLASMVDHYLLWHLALAQDGRLRRLDVVVLQQLRHRLPAGLDL